jgi:glucose-6-phosphate 1-dehydrogenase
MNATHSDALGFFGATDGLAYKKIFPALRAMLKRGQLDVPVIGVAKTGRNLDQLKARARERLEKHGGPAPAAFEKLRGLLRYLDGDYQDPATFRAITGNSVSRSDRRITSLFRQCCSERWWSHSEERAGRRNKWETACLVQPMMLVVTADE